MAWVSRFLWPLGLQLPSRTMIRHIVFGFLIGLSVSWPFMSFVTYHQRRKKERRISRLTSRSDAFRGDGIVDGVSGLIGNTPLMRIKSLSDALGVEILGKAEFLNPGGSVKDRVALQMIDDAERLGYIHPYTGSRIFEGTVGSTGISIATIARARGYDATIIMPDDVAEEKVKALSALGADIQKVRPASIVDKKQYVNLARQRAKEFGQEDVIDQGFELEQQSYSLTSPSGSVLVSAAPPHVGSNVSADNFGSCTPAERRGYFADQFENRSNFEAHYNGTGPEIWRQTRGRIDAFVAGAGTGGTVAGVGQYLKSMNKEIYVAISDPDGSGLFNKVRYGVLYDHRESEGTKRRHQVDTVVEGIGINRMTRNIESALEILDDAFRITDAEAVAMSRYLVQNDGLFLGSSSACNLMACVKLVKKMGWTKGKTVVTVLCDSGSRHYSKFWNDGYLHNANIPIDVGLVEDLIQSPPVLKTKENEA